MKKSLFTNRCKRTLLAVPAAALMLGAAHAGTTIGLNFQSWYYDSGTTPQTIGYGIGYQTTGFPATATAFGVAPANWVNLDPAYTGTGFSTTVNLAGVTAQLDAVNLWESDIGNLVNPADEWVGGPQLVSTSSVLPGNDEVTWSFEDNTGWTNTLSGLHTAFANGYVIELIGTAKCTASSRVVVTDGVNAVTNAFDSIYTAGNANFHGPVGLMALTAFTGDSLTFGAVSRNVSTPQSCALAGFIITDQPVIPRNPANTTVNQGATLELRATAIGVGTLSYQWQHDGTNYPGATTNPYSKTAAPEDAGNWVLVATNSYGSASSAAAAVAVNQIPVITTDLLAVTNTVFSGTPIGLSIVAGGANPLSYQWYQNGVAIPGATNAVLTGPSTATGLFGYSVTVSNQYSPPVATSATQYLHVVAAPDTYTTAVAGDAAYSFWPLGETTGDTAYDYSGFGHNLAISNGMTLGSTGPHTPTYPGFQAATKAYQFDGATAFLDGGTTASMDGPIDFTVEAWINTTSATAQLIAQQRDAAGFNGEYRFAVNADGTLTFFIYNNGYQANITSGAKVADGAWHHVVAVRSGVNLFIYVDGGLSASGSGPIASLVKTLRTYVGSDQRDHVAYFGGSMAAVAIYNKALSAAQIINHYRIGSGAPFVLSLKKGGLIEDTKPAGVLHPGSGHNVGWSNSITDGNNLTRTGVGVFATSSSSRIVTPGTPDFDSTMGTIMFWMQANAPIPGPGSEGAMLFDRRTTNGTVIVLNDGGGIEVQCSGGANSLTVGYLPDNNWHHVAVTYDQSASGSLEIFIDGVSYGSQPNAAVWSWPVGQELEIGTSHDPYWQRFDGNMDDFRTYNRILTASEIASVVSSDALVDTNALTLRYNFGTAAGIGQSVSWTFGTLYSSPTLGTDAVWTPMNGVLSPYSYLPTGTSMFFRAQY